MNRSNINFTLVSSYQIISRNQGKMNMCDWEKIWLSSTVKQLNRGDSFIHTGKVSKYSAFVLDGLLKQTYNDEDGNERNLNFYFSGDFLCNCESYKNNKPSVSSITAIENSVIMVVNNDELYHLKNTDHGIALWALSTSQSIMQQQSEHLQIISIKDPFERYCFLLQNKPHMIANVSGTELARYLYVSRETVSRARFKITEPA